MDARALARVTDSIQRDIDGGLCFGVVILVAHRGQIELLEALGTSGPASARPADIDDVFLLMSITKALTAAAVLQFVDRGLLQLDTRVADVVPEFAARGKQRITVYHLLTHTAGMYSGFTVPDGLGVFGGGDLGRAFAAASGLPPSHRPGARVVYSPWEGFAVLGELLHRIDPERRPYRGILREEVFEPLGMADTSIGRHPDDPRRVPINVVKRTGAGQSADAIESINFLDETAQLPGVNGYSTAADMFAFAEMIRNHGRGPDGARLISGSLVDYAYVNHTGSQPNGYWDFNKESEDYPEFPANFALGGGYSRGSGHYLTALGQTASATSFAAVGGGTTMVMVDPLRELTFVFLSAGMVEGLAHFRRLQRISDLVLASVDT